MLIPNLVHIFNFIISFIAKGADFTYLVFAMSIAVAFVLGLNYDITSVFAGASVCKSVIATYKNFSK